MINQNKINSPDSVDEAIISINNNLKSKRLAFLRGTFYGFGTVLGAGMAVIIIGYLLNMIGVIPQFRDEVTQWRKVFEQNQNNQTFVPIDGTK